MTVFASLPENAHLVHIFKRFPKFVPALLDLHDAILRSDSPLSVGERELLAAYTSMNNACQYCFGAHSTIAKIFGMEESLLQALADDIAIADVPEKIKPLLVYVKKLTLTPAKITQEDADQVYSAGWSEEALFDAICTCALFNFMNRIVDGSDITVQHRDIRRPEGQAPSYKTYGELQKIIDRFELP